MANAQSDERTISIESPATEEEVPFDTDRAEAPGYTGATKELGAKGTRAFWLACICLFALVALTIIDVFHSGDSKTAENTIEILKYVITMALGYFFATAKKE